MATKEHNGAGDSRRNRERKPQPKHTAPEVVYTPGKAFQRNRLILRLLTIVAVVLAISMGLSIFFRVDTVEISGAQKYDPATIWSASGIEEGDSLLFFGKAGTAAKIIRQLPYVRSVRFDVRLPGTVHIIVEESPTAYSIRCTEGLWWLITADGRVAEQTDGATAGNYTKILGVELQSPEVGGNAVAAEPVQEGAYPVVITGADRLNTALSIVQTLEKNEILGKAASVDVSNLQDLEFWYGTQYRVKLGNTDRLDYKIVLVKGAIAELSPYETGIMDATLTINPDGIRLLENPK